MGRETKGTDVRPTAVSLFTGAGGLDIGIEQAGFRTVAAVECDDDCVETLRLNQRRGITIPPSDEHRYLAETAISHKKVEDVEASDLRPDIAGAKWAPDLVVGGPPCQPFSSSGSMLSVADPRGRLFEHFVRLTEALQPRFVLFENVRGLVTACGPKKEPGEALMMVKDAFEKAGYATRFALLNAADHGCPQRRVCVT
jgi:DNA (cytosine-5)-methyltransferase 1